MKTFRDFTESGNHRIGLTVFDIDETLFKTFATIWVEKDGKRIRPLTNQEFNDYKLAEGEEFDFGEFADAKKFAETSKPITKMIEKARLIIKDSAEAGDKVIIMTARADFDDKKRFLKVFHDHGLNVDDVYVERAGNFKGSTPSKSKKFLFRKYLGSDKYHHIRFFDDSIKNIRAFKSLEKKYKDVVFDAYLVDEHGGINEV